MAKRAKKKDEKDDGPKTQARKSFDANMEPMGAMVNRIRPKEVTRATTSITRAAEKWNRTKEKKDVRSLTRASQALIGVLGRWSKLRDYSFESMSVMLVVFLEAYLEDGLVELATRSPVVLKLKEMPAPEASRVFEVETIEELRDEVRRQWAQGKVKGGPEEWEKRLTHMGARGYVKEETYALQHLWDTRNLIVHSRSIVSAAYAKKHKALGMSSGVRMGVANNLFSRWLTAVTSFMDVTDAFFLKFGSAKTNEPQ